MHIIRSCDIVAQVPNFDQQLAALTRTAWTGEDGRCYFPYTPLTTANYWRHKIARGWTDGSMESWVLIEDGRIVSHAALVNKGTHWELGRLFASHAPPGGTHALCKERLAFCRDRGIQARMECTQAHTSAQWHADRVGLRFAGIGFLDKIDGINWDIIFFDTLEAPDFVPRPGVTADPLGVEILCDEKERARLREIQEILTSDRGGRLPATRFHVLPRLLEPVRQIINLNVPGIDKTHSCA